MKLYEISEEITALISNAEADAIENDGVISDYLVDRLKNLEMAFVDKVEGVCLYIKNSLALSEALKKEEEALFLRRKCVDNRIASLKNYLQVFVQDKVETSKIKLSFKKSKSVIIDDFSQIPLDFLVIKEEKTPNKKMIKSEIEAGRVVTGASLVENRNVIIS